MSDEKTGLRAVIECPTKTMNIEPKRRLYQVDTGPVAYPDLSKLYDPPIDCLRLAFVAFNADCFVQMRIKRFADGFDALHTHIFQRLFELLRVARNRRAQAS